MTDLSDNISHEDLHLYTVPDPALAGDLPPEPAPGEHHGRIAHVHLVHEGSGHSECGLPVTEMSLYVRGDEWHDEYRCERCNWAAVRVA